MLFMAMPMTLLAKGKDPQVKYVFYMIGDGMGINEVVGAELYNAHTGLGPEKINFLDFPVRGFVTTHSSNALVTDSAAGYGSHSGSPVGLYVKGAAAEEFLPARDNTDIAPIIAKVAGYSNK